MVLITDLQRRAGVCTVSFESAPKLSCSREFAQRLKLGRGQDIDEIVLDRIRATAATDLAEHLAHKLLQRPRSRRELAARLLQSGVPREAALEVLERIEADGEHDDEDDALELARRCISGNESDWERAQRRCGNRLQRRGFSHSTASRAVLAAWQERLDQSDPAAGAIFRSRVR